MNNMAPDEVNEEEKTGEEKMNNMAPDEVNEEEKTGEEKMNNMASDEVNEEQKMEEEEKMNNMAPDEVNEEEKTGDKEMNDMAPDETGEEKINNVDTNEVNEEQKEPPGEKDDEHEGAGGEFPAEGGDTAAGAGGEFPSESGAITAEDPEEEVDIKTPVADFTEDSKNEAAGADKRQGEIPTLEKQVPSKKLSVEKLPNIIVCGTNAVDIVPKIIVCRPMMDCDTQPFSETESSVKGPEDEDGEKEIKEPLQKIEIKGDVLSGLFDRIERCYSIQQRMYDQIKLLEQSRYELQLEVIHKDNIVEDLQKKINTLESELHTAVKGKLECQLLSSQKQHPPMCRKQLCENFAIKTNEIGSGSEVREREVKPTGDAGEKDLDSIQDERCQCKQNEKFTSFWGQVPTCKLMLPTKETQTDGLEFDPIFVSEANPEYRTLQEQYCRLKTDYHNKVTEASSIWNDLMNLKQETNKQCLLLKETEAMMQNLLEANKYLEAEKHKLLLYRGQCSDLEQQRNLAKQKLRAFEEECDNTCQILADQTAQLEHYRTKYLYTSQLFEELKQDMEEKNRNYCKKLAIDDQQMKAKEEKYLEEIMVLNTKLQDVQSKLEDKTQLHSIALDNITELSKKTLELTTENDQLKVQLYNISNEEKVNQLLSNLEITEKKLEEVQLENARLRSLTNRLEAMQSENNRRFEEKAHENRQLITQLETLREESARQVAMVKDRCETVKKSMQGQINDMETELIRSRAALCTAKKDKDEIRKKMQLQIMNLNDNFNAAQTNIELLLNHVVHLKTSRTQYLKTGGDLLCSSLSNNDEKASVETSCRS